MTTAERRIHLLLLAILCCCMGSIHAEEQLTPEQLNQARTAFEAEKQAIADALNTESFLRTTTTRQPFASGEVRPSSGGKLDTSLTVSYFDHPIWSVAQNRFLTLRHRCYEESVVGPTLRVQPGDMLRVRMINQLPDPGGSDHHDGDNHITPKRLNTTNLHTHGLHVSPAGNSDNVLVHIAPGDEFQNEIYIPEDHPPGTFWYHAHVHGSTAMQVSSGMAGALIVEGGLDTVPAIAAMEERIFLFQQITHHPKDGEQDVVEVEDFHEVMGFGKWAPGVASGRWRTTINGQTVPLITMQPGEIQRWRFIHGGVRESIDVHLENHEFHEIAADGLAFGDRRRRTSIMLNPGYRSDVLVQAGPAPDGPVTTFLIDRETSAEDSLLNEPEAPNVLAVVVISGSPRTMSLPDNDELEPFKPFDSINDGDLTDPGQTVRFNIVPGSPTSPTLFHIDGKAFDPTDAPRPLKLGTASEWTVSSGVGSHPFHIHVNPFEIIEMRDRNDVVVPSERIWKDTLLVPSGWTIRLRSRYRRYIGKFVLHCHILDHEDQGMMQLVEIAP